MLTAATNALALARIGSIRLIHSGGRGGFGVLLMALICIGAVRSPRQAAATQRRAKVVDSLSATAPARKR